MIMNVLRIQRSWRRHLGVDLGLECESFRQSFWSVRLNTSTKGNLTIKWFCIYSHIFKTLCSIHSVNLGLKHESFWSFRSVRLNTSTKPYNWVVDTVCIYGCIFKTLHSVHSAQDSDLDAISSFTGNATYLRRKKKKEQNWWLWIILRVVE